MTHSNTHHRSSGSQTCPKELWKEYRVAWRALGVAIRRADNEAFRVKKLHPPVPPELKIKIKKSRIARTIMEHELLGLRDGGPYEPEVIDALLAKFRKWRKECEAIDAQHLDPSFAAAKEEAESKCWAIEKQLLKAPVRTVEDIGYKLRYLTDRSDDDEVIRSANHVIRQIEAGKVS